MNARSLRGLLCSVVALGCLVVPAAVLASGGAKLKITQFSMEATRATRLANLKNEAEIENLPYVPPFTQAGSHPWALTTLLEFGQEPLPGEMVKIPTQEPKDVFVELPPGLLGNPLAGPRCSLTVAFGEGACPADTQIGVYRVRWFDGKQTLGPIVDVSPEKGQSAEFALENEFHVSASLTGHLIRVKENGRESYELSVSSTGIPLVQLYRVETTFWGVPADPSHDPMRGLFCKSTGESTPFECQHGNETSGAPPVPFLTLPTGCAAGPETATVRTDSWEEPGTVSEGRYQGFTEASATLPGATGCNLLAFDPAIEARPDTEAPDEPVGLDVNVRVPLNEEVAAAATPQLRDARVTLPEGLSVNAGVVDGIRACEPTGPEGINITGPESERVSVSGELQLAPGKCPDASAVGTAEAITPLLSEPVRGHVYLARPGCGNTALGQNPCTEEDARDGDLYKLYLELGGEGELETTGVHIKVEGRTLVNLATGQITSVFDENPQTPFSELKIHLNGGPKAPLANPAVCGAAVTTADFTPWSAPGITPEGVFVNGTPDATPSSFYEVGPGGCPAVWPFKPLLAAGTVSPTAGQFSSFTLNLARGDREQYVKGIQVHTPPGLSGLLSSVTLCGEADADAGTCPASSQIGTTRVASGAGSDPFEIEGKIYITGPYEGSPFGLSIAVPVVAGPFNLGTKVVRARIAVDPANASLTVTTDETGPYAVPQIVFGVPVRLKRIAVRIDRPGFMFNPTNCAAQQVTATVSGSQQAKWTTSSPFAAAGCKSLGFKPSFAVSTSGHTSRSLGASLDVHLSYPKGAMGSDANIAKVKVSLPKQLPSYLPTLQKACVAAKFEANPGSCPAGSIVGIARATTPLLPVGLSGPVYFVSHGGEEFPSLIIVLQGYGVRVDLTGSTFISEKTGITSSTFRTVPDVPVKTFELYLPQGKNHALAANTNLCTATHNVTVKQKRTRKIKGRTISRTVTVSRKARGLVMPTEFVAQNGLVAKQQTNITITGCSTTKTSTKRNK